MVWMLNILLLIFLNKKTTNNDWYNETGTRKIATNFYKFDQSLAEADEFETIR